MVASPVFKNIFYDNFQQRSNTMQMPEICIRNGNFLLQILVSVDIVLYIISCTHNLEADNRRGAAGAAHARQRRLAPQRSHTDTQYAAPPAQSTLKYKTIQVPSNNQFRTHLFSIFSSHTVIHSK